MNVSKSKIKSSEKNQIINPNINVVILAAGKGTRMRSSLPKVMHPIANKPMVQHVIESARSLSVGKINIVYGFGGDILKSYVFGDDISFIEQKEQLGTGHAVNSASSNINDDDDVLVLYGDVPLTKTSTLKRLIKMKPKNGMSLLTVNLANPNGYGRIVRKDDAVVGIVEQKDASPIELLITECNTGILIANGGDLKRWLSNLSNKNAQNEYYLTDIIAACHSEGKTIVASNPDSEIEVEGANNRVQLASLERAYQMRQAEDLMIAGARLIDPSRIDVRGSITLGKEVEIDINCIFEGDCVIEDNVKIGANCIIKNSTIGAWAVIKPNSIIENSTLEEGASAGPFARLRPGTHLMKDAHVGNFVEVKKTSIGTGSKVGHLTYLGDAKVGSNVNVGAGTITCNYDGQTKHPTVIDDNAFVGSNSSLVAPVHIGKNSTLAAGSTITENVKANELAFGRAKQTNKEKIK